MFLLFAALHVPELTTILPAIVAGAVAVYVLLPRPRPLPWLLGAGLAAIAVLLTGATILRTGAVTPETFLFYSFSAIAVISGGMLVTQHNPARAALSFAVVILSTCGLFLLLAAPFLAVATIIIYAGAIIVTFLFVLMLAQQSGLGDADARSREPLLATFTGFILLGALLYVLQLVYQPSAVAQQSDELLALTREARAALSPEHYPAEQLDKLKNALDNALDSQDFASGKDYDSLKDSRKAIEDMNTKSEKVTPPEAEVRRKLTDLEQLLLGIRAQTTWLMPRGQTPGSFSDLSGPSANEPAQNLRYDAEGRPQLPAENTAYLGRALFTDYLLPVELGGFLLLVAAIGSIAIAHRRTPSERSV